MGVLGKLLGKKKTAEDIPGLEGFGHEEKSPESWGMPELGPAPKPPTAPQEPVFEEPAAAPPMRQPQPMPMASQTNTQLEIINSKLDTIRAVLTSLEMRIANLEKIARGDEDQKRYY